LKRLDTLAKETLSPEALTVANTKGAELVVTYALAQIRKQCGTPQRRVADVLNIQQPSVSELENRPDMLVSTLSNYLASIGGELELIAKIPGGKRLSIQLANGQSR
jgi:predicted XRE-type DNA-binding protein